MKDRLRDLLEAYIRHYGLTLDEAVKAVRADLELIKKDPPRTKERR